MVKPSIIPEGVRKEDKDAKGKESALPAFAVIPLGTEFPLSPAEDPQYVIPVVKRPRKLGLCLCLSAILLTILLIIGLAFALFIGHHSNRYQFRCGVGYDFPNYDAHGGPRPDNTLQEDIEVDPYEGYEQIEIPEQDSFERLTILHDFTINMTAYRLHHTQVCYITSLDKTIVMGPQEFVEHALENPNFLTEHYETVHETYRVIMPKLSSVSSGYGYYIPILCGYVDSYKIEKIPVNELEAWEEHWEDNDDDNDDHHDDDDNTHLPAPPRPVHRRRRGATAKCSKIMSFDGKVKAVRICTP